MSQSLGFMMYKNFSDSKSIWKEIVSAICLERNVRVNLDEINNTVVKFNCYTGLTFNKLISTDNLTEEIVKFVDRASQYWRNIEQQTMKMNFLTIIEKYDGHVQEQSEFSFNGYIYAKGRQIPVSYYYGEFEIDDSFLMYPFSNQTFEEKVSECESAPNM